MPPLVAVLFALTPPCTHHPRHVAPCIPIYGEEGAGAGREDGAERGRGQGKERAKYAAPWPGPENTFASPHRQICVGHAATFRHASPAASAPASRFFGGSRLAAGRAASRDPLAPGPRRRVPTFLLVLGYRIAPDGHVFCVVILPEFRPSRNLRRVFVSLHACLRRENLQFLRRVFDFIDE